MTPSDIAGIIFGCLLYGIAVTLVIANRGSQRDVLWRTARFVATWGIGLCLIAGLGCAAMSGRVGFIGGSLAMLLWTIWGTLCFYATRLRPNGHTNGRS